MASSVTVFDLERRQFLASSLILKHAIVTITETVLLVTISLCMFMLIPLCSHDVLFQTSTAETFYTVCFRQSTHGALVSQER